ncbi:MAG: sodium-translocating pyrophosphatase [Spirochaetota bacterium]
MSDTLWIIVALALGVASIAVALLKYYWVVRQRGGEASSQQVARHIRRSAEAFLRYLYLSLAVVALIMGALLALLLGFDLPLLFQEGELAYDVTAGIGTAVTFVIGAIFAAIAGYMGMSIAVQANVRTAAAAERGLVPAFKVAFNGGSVMGLGMIGIAIVGISLIYLFTQNVNLVLGFSFGASALALLAKAGGGIYTKIADISADLVGKVEFDIAEDDARNPGSIADNVGDNVGDIAGMGADIYDSYVASVVAAMLLGVALVKQGFDERYIVFPLMVSAAGILASIVGSQLVRVRKGGDPGRALNIGTVLTCVLFAGFVAVVVFAGGFGMGVFIPAVAGVVIGLVIGYTTNFFTSDLYAPVKLVAKYSKSGSAINIITGFSYGLLSIVPFVVGIVAAMLVSYFGAEAYGVGGIYGVAIAAVGMLSITGMVVSADAYGPIADNAKGIAEMSGLGEDAIATADELDSAGNTAAAVAKGFAIGAAALTVLSLFHAYGEEIRAAGGEITITLSDPLVLAGLFLGSITPPLFSAITMLAVTRNAYTMIGEIRRQFTERPGILEGTETPDYERCVRIASHDALKALVAPALIAVLLPLLVGFILGPSALGGFLGGSIFTGVIFALFMANGGGLWDNAKKWIEAGNLGGKGSEEHKASVVGDTVGDPFKDTAGPSLNTLITVMSLVSSVFAPLIAVLHLF